MFGALFEPVFVKPHLLATRIYVYRMHTHLHGAVLEAVDDGRRVRCEVLDSVFRGCRGTIGRAPDVKLEESYTFGKSDVRGS